MVHHKRLSLSLSNNHIERTEFADTGAGDLIWPFGKLDGLDRHDLRQTAYEIFFTSCRSSPGFGGRSAITYYNPSSPDGGDGGGSTAGMCSGQNSPGKANGVGMAVTSRIKRALGLKMLKRSLSRRASSIGSNPSSPGSSAPGSPGTSFTVPSASQSRPRRPMTSAEIMRQQMRVTEQDDNRLRKTLMRTLVGQMGRRAETIILPLELLRHLKPCEFNDSREYHLWQKRQLKIIEAGLLLHPSIPLEKSDSFAMSLREIIAAGENKPIDTGKNSDTMKTLCNCVVSLAWRTPEADVCRWADGYPVNVHIYNSLLSAVFDIRDETLVLDEIDELLELMKKTWSTLGLNRSIHNLCFTWVLFHQFIITGQTESDLLGAALAMLAEVANDAKRADREPLYVKMLGSVLTSMKRWSEKRLVDYHGSFDRRSSVGLMENILPLVFSATKILEEDVPGHGAASSLEREDSFSIRVEDKNFRGDCRVDQYIRSSLSKAFTKIVDNIGDAHDDMTLEVEEVSETLLQLAKETEDLAAKEKETFSPVLKKWHPIAAGVAAVTLHTCYGTLLKQYLKGSSSLSNDTISIMQRAGKLEKVLVQMVVEDSVDCEDGGKTIVREMVPYEVDSVILNLLRQWIQEKLKTGKEVLQRAKETETWNPKSKTEPFAYSAGEVIKYAKETVDEFFEIPIGISEDLVCDLADGFEHLFRDYTTFVATCGSKQSYIPTLPPLTRCSQDSKFFKLWRIAGPCQAGIQDPILHINADSSSSSIDQASNHINHNHNNNNNSNNHHHPRPSTSRGTQRLYIRLNTLHYFQSQLHSLDKALSFTPRLVPSPTRRFHTRTSSSYFDKTRSSIQVASQHVSEVAAYRLIFLDSNSVFYGSLYVGDVENARIDDPALKILKQNLTLLAAIVTERAQSLALKEAMKACFEAYLMVLLAGGSSRIFHRSDHEMIEEDFDGLKRVFCACGEGLIAEDVVEREAQNVEGVVDLMSQSTEQLVEDFSIVACESSGMGGVVGVGQKLPMPPTTGRWHRSDPNTILRVLCYRNDRLANQFLKRTFQLARRR